ncbi:hypothetical protein, partial [Mesorhizobium sp.]|uniref:hypothetical protein n=1 Tax=Mesorhizobium sp. TaxID=1871066 RepID=UPI0025E611F2
MAMPYSAVPAEIAGFLLAGRTMRLRGFAFLPAHADFGFRNWLAGFASAVVPGLIAPASGKA